MKKAEEFAEKYPFDKLAELFPSPQKQPVPTENTDTPNIDNITSTPSKSENTMHTNTPNLSQKKSRKPSKTEIRQNKQIAYLLNNELDKIEEAPFFISAEDEMYGINKPFLKLFDLTECAAQELHNILSEAKNPKRAIDMFIDTLESISSGTKDRYYVNEFVHTKGIKRVFVCVDFSDKRYDEDNFPPYYLYFRRKKGINHFEILHIIRTSQGYLNSLTYEMEEDISDEEDDDDDIIEF